MVTWQWLNPLAFRFSGVGIIVRRIPLTSATCIAALIRIPMNVNERRRMRPKMRPPGDPSPPGDLRPWSVGGCGEPSRCPSTSAPSFLIASSQRGQCRRPDGAANLRASDYHKPLPDNSGHARTVSCDHRRCLCPVRTGAGCWRSFRAGKGWRRPWWPFRRRVLGYVARRVDDLASEEAMVRDPGGGVPEVLNETDNSSGAWERSVAANTFRTLMLYP